jgi:uroporphyrinogen decarboxylase
MNGHQRISAVLKGEWPDRRPVMLHNFMMAVPEYGITMSQFREDPRKAAAVFIQSAEKYDVDGIIIDFDTVTTAEALGVPVDHPEFEPARASGSLLNDLSAIGELPVVDLAKNERIQIWLETSRLVKSHFGEELFVRGNCDQAPFSLATMIRGTENWMMDLLIMEEQAHELLEYSFNICREFIRLMIETGVDMVSNGDSTSGPELIAPEMYRKFAWPYEKRLVEFVHEAQMPYLIHICGDTAPILDDMIVTGADAFELDYKTDINLIYEKMADKITFVGNIDPSGVLALGTKELVAQKTRELMEVYSDSPRFVLNAGCAIPPSTPAENIFEMIKVSREYNR